MKRALIFGASSGIAEAFAHELLKKYPDLRLGLVARNRSKLDAIQSDLSSRYRADIVTCELDLADYDRLPSEVAQLVEKLGGSPEAVLMAHGTLGDESQTQVNFAKALPVLSTNFLSPVAVCSALLPHLSQRSVLGVITSVAGDRGRASNFIYGSAKAGLQAYLSGLRAKLFSQGIHVLDIRPGFVSTAMTAHLNRSGPLWASPDKVARDILKAFERRCDVLYTPGFWRLIMLVIRALPGAVFKRLKF